MRTFDFYASIGLDRAKPPGQLAADIDWALTAPGLDAGQIDQLRTARAILGDPARRAIYDRHLDDPAAGPLGVEELRQLAGTGSGAGPVGPGPAPAAGAHPGPPAGGGAGARLRHGLVAGARRGWARVAGAARTRPRAALGAAAAVLVLALVLAAGILGLGGADDGAGGLDRFATEKWEEERFGEELMDPPSERYLDSELAGRALFHSFSQRTDVPDAYLPNGRFRPEKAGLRTFALAAVPGRNPYEVEIQPGDSSVKLENVRVAFAEGADGPVVVRTGLHVQDSAGIQEATAAFVVELYDAASGAPISRQEIAWDSPTTHAPLALTCHEGTIAIAVYDETLSRSGFRGISFLDLAANEFTTRVDAVAADERGITEGALVEDPENQVAYIDGRPYLGWRTRDDRVTALRMLDLATGRFHEVTSSSGYERYGIDFLEYDDGLVIVDYGPQEIYTWSPESGLSAPVMSIARPDGGVPDGTTVRAAGHRAIVELTEILPDGSGRELHVIDLTTGEGIFHLSAEQLDGLTVGEVTADDRFVYVADGERYYAIDPATGTQLEDPPLSVPLPNSGGYAMRKTPPKSTGWSGARAIFAFH